MCAASQVLDQLALELPNRDDVNVAVNRFVGGVHRGQLRVLEFERACDFLRRPASPEPGLHLVAQRRPRGDITAAALTGTLRESAAAFARVAQLLALPPLRLRFMLIAPAERFSFKATVTWVSPARNPD